MSITNTMLFAEQNKKIKALVFAVKDIDKKFKALTNVLVHTMERENHLQEQIENLYREITDFRAIVQFKE